MRASKRKHTNKNNITAYKFFFKKFNKIHQKNTNNQKIIKKWQKRKKINFLFAVRPIIYLK